MPRNEQCGSPRGPRPLVSRRAGAALGGDGQPEGACGSQVRLCGAPVLPADAQPRPTRCAALPGGGGHVRLSAGDPVTRLPLRQPNTLVPGRELVGNAMSPQLSCRGNCGHHYPVRPRKESVTSGCDGCVESRAERRPACASPLPPPMPSSNRRSLGSLPSGWHSPGTTGRPGDPTFCEQCKKQD